MYNFNNPSYTGGTTESPVTVLNATIPINFANAIATSVTSPIYTASAADLNINSAANNNIVVKMGDAAAAQKVSFTDSGSVEVASIDSDGRSDAADDRLRSLPPDENDGRYEKHSGGVPLGRG